MRHVLAGVVCLVLPMLAWAADDKPPTREQAIAQTRAVIAGHVKSHGGSWEAWGRSLEKFRADLREHLARKDWVKHGIDDFKFMGKTLDVALMDQLPAEPAATVPATQSAASPQRDPLETIIATTRALQARGIDVIVVPIPDKIAVYPDKLSVNAPEDRLVAVAMYRAMDHLLANGVEVVDLYTLYRDYRQASGDKVRLYQKMDTHWHNVAAQLAAGEIVRRLKRYDFVQEALKKDNPFVVKADTRAGKSDLAGKDGKARVAADPDLNDAFRAVAFADGRPYADDPDSPIVMFSDSFGMLNMHNGGYTPAQVAYGIRMPIAHVCREGIGPQVPVTLAREEKGKLGKRKVVIWTCVAREFASAKRWVPVPAEALAVPAGSGEKAPNEQK